MLSAIKNVLDSTELRNFMLGSYLVNRIFWWGSNKYLWRYSHLDARYFRWLFLLEQSRKLEGDIVELGVGPGRFLIYCATWLKANRSDKRYYGYDTFSGFPSVNEKDKENLSKERLKRVSPGNYAFSKARIEKLVRQFQLRNLKLIEGDFTQTLKKIKPQKISFLYIDCDLYEGYKSGLEILYDHIVPGGFILFDEYDRINEWPGARRAVDEFFVDKVEKPQRLPFSSSFYVKRADNNLRIPNLSQKIYV